MLRILVPEPDATVRDMEGNLIVTAMSEPGLRDGHNYRLVLDGKAQGEPGRSPVFPLSNLDRGTHQLAVEIIDDKQRVVERTPNQPVHIMRITLAQKRQARPCKKADYGVRPECPLRTSPRSRTRASSASSRSSDPATHRNGASGCTDFYTLPILVRPHAAALR